MPEADFSNFWAAGRLGWAGRAAEAYDLDLFQAWKEKVLAPGLALLPWLYPPPMLLLAAAWALLPLLPAFLAWTALSCAAAALLLRAAGRPWAIVLIGCFGPPTWRGLLLGQFSPLATALVATALLLSGRRPGAAGVMGSLATLKPQLGLLLPVAWLAQRRWNAFGIAAAGTVLLLALSVVVLGTDVLPAFRRGAGEAGQTFLEQQASAFPVAAASVFWMARGFGAPVAVAYAAQALGALAALAITWLAARRFAGDDRAVAAIVLCATLLVSPYLYASDYGGCSVAVALLIERRPAMTPALLLLWVAPGLSEPLCVCGVPPLLPLLAGFVALLAWRSAAANQTAALQSGRVAIAADGGA